jgi:hypothetical protein
MRMGNPDALSVQASAMFGSSCLAKDCDGEQDVVRSWDGYGFGATLTGPHMIGRVIRRMIAVLALAATALAGPAMADPARFPLRAGEPAAQVFDTGQATLDFTAPALPGLVWTPADVLVGGPPDLFTDRREVLVGVDPQDRERLEVRILTGVIEPRRVLLAADYARVLAPRWGTANFGTFAHGPAFGEVLVGDDRSGAMQVTRLSVFRRGDRVLVIAVRFPGAGTGIEGPPGLAAFLGSLTFADPAVPDLLDGLPQVASIPAPDGRAALAVRLPVGWGPLDLPPPPGADLRVLVDANDPRDDIAVLAGLIPRDAALPMMTDQALTGAAQAIAESMVRTLLPDGPFQIVPGELTRLDAFADPGLVHGLYTFRVDRPGAATTAVTVLLSAGAGGPAAIAGVMTPFPDSPIGNAAFLHGNALMMAQVQAQLDFWTARAAP